MIEGYDEWKLHDGIGVEKPVQRCTKCGSDLYKGEGVLLYDNDYYCDSSCLIEDLAYEGVVL